MLLSHYLQVLNYDGAQKYAYLLGVINLLSKRICIVCPFAHNEPMPLAHFAPFTMAQRACEETAERCSASALLHAYMRDLVDAIQDAEIPAITMKLYSSKVISRDTQDRVDLSSLIATEKTLCLLKALESAVTTQPQVLDTFLDILDQYRPSAVIAKKMRDRLRKCSVVYHL